MMKLFLPFALTGCCAVAGPGVGHAPDVSPRPVPRPVELVTGPPSYVPPPPSPPETPTAPPAPPDGLSGNPGNSKPVGRSGEKADAGMAEQGTHGNRGKSN